MTKTDFIALLDEAKVVQRHLELNEITFDCLDLSGLDQDDVSLISEELRQQGWESQIDYLWDEGWERDLITLLAPCTKSAHARMTLEHHLETFNA